MSNNSNVESKIEHKCTPILTDTEYVCTSCGCVVGQENEVLESNSKENVNINYTQYFFSKTSSKKLNDLQYRYVGRDKGEPNLDNIVRQLDVILNRLGLAYSKILKEDCIKLCRKLWCKNITRYWRHDVPFIAAILLFILRNNHTYVFRNTRDICNVVVDMTDKKADGRRVFTYYSKIALLLDDYKAVETPKPPPTVSTPQSSMDYYTRLIRQICSNLQLSRTIENQALEIITKIDHQHFAGRSRHGISTSVLWYIFKKGKSKKTITQYAFARAGNITSACLRLTTKFLSGIIEDYSITPKCLSQESSHEQNQESSI